MLNIEDMIAEVEGGVGHNLNDHKITTAWIEESLRKPNAIDLTPELGKSIRVLMAEYKVDSLNARAQLGDSEEVFLQTKNLMEIGTRLADILRLIEQEAPSKFAASQEEKYGHLLEKILLVVSRCNPNLSVADVSKNEAYPSIDLVIYDHTTGVLWLVGVKSGCNWGNSDSLAAQAANYDAVKKWLTEDKGKVFDLGFPSEPMSIQTMTMHGYGPSGILGPTDKRDGYVLEGQAIWYWITRNPHFVYDLHSVMSEGAEEFEAALKEAEKVAVHKLIQKAGQLTWRRGLEISVGNLTRIVFDRKKTALLSDIMGGSLWQK